ncbi:MAG: hypothetical protein ACXAC5_03160 [Promethearchaeota archaeon]
MFYSDYYAFIAEAGLNRARALFPGIAVSTLVDVTTIINRPNTDVATANLARSLDTSYEYLWLDGQHIDPIRDGFEGLSAYVLEATGDDVEAYLIQEGIKVKPLYATLANMFGEEITSGNIEGV